MPFIGTQPAETALTTGNLGDDIVTLAKLASGTDGNIISYDSSGNPVAIATGNDGQVLTSAGAGAQPAFETLSAGKILQVVQDTETATQSTTSTSFTALSGLSANITCASTSNKVLVTVVLNIASSGTNQIVTQLTKGGTVIDAATGDAASSRSRSSGYSQQVSDSHMHNHVYSYLDSPSSTSALTYAIKWKVDAGTGYLNRTGGDGDNDDYPRLMSSITLQEVDGT